MNNLPKFLVADDGQRDFVVHCYYPKFVLEINESGGTPVFFDSESDFITLETQAGREPAQSIARLMREAMDFFQSQCD